MGTEWSRGGILTVEARALRVPRTRLPLILAVGKVCLLQGFLEEAESPRPASIDSFLPAKLSLVDLERNPFCSRNGLSDSPQKLVLSFAVLRFEAGAPDGGADRMESPLGMHCLGGNSLLSLLLKRRKIWGNS